MPSLPSLGEEGGWAGDEDYAEEGDEAGKLLAAGEGLVEEDGGGPAGDDGGEEGDYGCVGEGKVGEGVVHAVDLVVRRGVSVIVWEALLGGNGAEEIGRARLEG